MQETERGDAYRRAAGTLWAAGWKSDAYIVWKYISPFGRCQDGSALISKKTRPTLQNSRTDVCKNTKRTRGSDSSAACAAGGKALLFRAGRCIGVKKRDALPLKE